MSDTDALAALRMTLARCANALEFHNMTPTGRVRSCLPECVACRAIKEARAALATRRPHEHEFIRRDGWWCVCGEAFKPEDDPNA